MPGVPSRPRARNFPSIPTPYGTAPAYAVALALAVSTAIYAERVALAARPVCDDCGRHAADVQPIDRDADGEPDGAELCGSCRGVEA
jgi:hypothetical protein